MSEELEPVDPVEPPADGCPSCDAPFDAVEILGADLFRCLACGHHWDEAETMDERPERFHRWRDEDA